jgi:hypothetical protein
MRNAYKILPGNPETKRKLTDIKIVLGIMLKK